MTSVLRTAYVNVLPKTDEFDPELKKRLNRIDASSSGERIGKSFGGGFSGAAVKLIGGIGALFAGIQVAGFFKDSIAEAREAVQAGKLTEAVIRSTGGAAKVSAAQIGELAGSLSLKTGVDDEAIQSGENLLLTFTRVHNETGKGNDIFNQASSTIVDMTAAMNNGSVTAEGLKTSTIQVGKALNDPIKGMTALSKVGVTFTDQQKEQIKNFVDSGNIMGAQKVILKELATEFGGAAAAAADPAQKALVAWGNFKEMIGGLVLPIFTNLVGLFTDRLLPVLQDRLVPAVARAAELFGGGFSSGARDAAGFMEQAGAAARTAWLGIQALVEAFKGGGVTSDGFVGSMERLGVVLRGVFDWLRDTGLPAARDFGSWLLNHMDVVKAVGIAYLGFRAAVLGYAIGQGIATLATTLSTEGTIANTIVMNLARGATIAATVAQYALGAAVRFALGPFGIAITVIGALTAAFIYAYNHSETFRNFINKIGASFLEFVDTVKNTAIAVAKWAVDLYNSFLKSYNDVKNWGINVYSSFQAFIATLVNAALAVRDWAVKVGNSFMDFLNTVRNVWNSIKEATGIAWNFLQEKFDGIVNWVTVKIPNAFNSFVDSAKRAWNNVKSAVQEPITGAVKFVINPLIGGFNKLSKVFGGPQVAEIAGFAAGGRIPGPMSVRDNRLAIGPGGKTLAVATGEFIVRATQTKKFLPILEAINRGRMPSPSASAAAYRDSYATGGLIGGLVDIGKNLFDAVLDPVKFLKAPLEAVLSRIPGAGGIRDVVVGIGKSLLNSAVNKLKSLFAAGGGGPIGNWPSSPAAQRGDSGVWRSIVGLIQSTGPLSGSFGNAYRPGDPLWHGSGRAVDWMGFNQGALATFFMARMGSVLELIHRTNNRDYAVTRGRNQGSFDQSLMEAHRNHIHIAMAKGGLVGQYDSGGPWPTGTLGFNGSGKTEYVLSGDSMNGLLDRVEELIDAVRRIAPGVGDELRGHSRGLIVKARTT